MSCVGDYVEWQGMGFGFDSFRSEIKQQLNDELQILWILMSPNVAKLNHQKCLKKHGDF